jgi:hypothetical protein
MNGVMAKNRLVVASLVAVSGFSQARDLRLELPIVPAISNASRRGTIGPTVTFEFGNTTRPNLQVIAADVQVSEYARPYDVSRGRNYRRDEASTCNEAFRNALSYAVDEAKARGANHLVVSYSTFLGEKGSDPKRYFVCNSGLNSSTVDMIVSYARLSPSPVAAKAVTASKPPPDVVPDIAARALPSASGYADVYDIGKIPYISDACKKAYAQWLTKNNPKAFVISPKGFCGFSWGTTPPKADRPADPSARALQACNARTSEANDCAYYAIDGVVVWQP